MLYKAILFSITIMKGVPKYLMNYTPTLLHDSIRIDKLYTIHYFEYMSDFTFEGERHDFWEFLYVDKGEVFATADTKEVLLKKGEILFHQPDEFHAVNATGRSAPNLIVVSFSSPSPAMHFFVKRLLQLDDVEQKLLAEIIREARSCFSCRLDDPYLAHMEKKSSDVFGSEQMIRLLLEQFLIHIIRRQSRLSALKNTHFLHTKSIISNQNADELYQNVVEYLETHLGEKLSLNQICHEHSVGRSHLQKLFRQKSGYSVMEFFYIQKIDTAKELLRTNQLNITQISEQLGYTSVHYFSRQFKKMTGMSPSEYASSVKAISEGTFM